MTERSFDTMSERWPIDPALIAKACRVLAEHAARQQAKRKHKRDRQAEAAAAFARRALQA